MTTSYYSFLLCSLNLLSSNFGQESFFFGCCRSKDKRDEGKRKCTNPGTVNDESIIGELLPHGELIQKGMNCLGNLDVL